MWNGAVGSSWNADRKTVNVKPHITKKRGVNRRSDWQSTPILARRRIDARTRASRHQARQRPPRAVARAPTAANVDGSAGVTPCSSPRSSRVDAERGDDAGGDAGQRQRQRRCASTIRSTCTRPAPIATRMPISRVRRLTTYDSTP